MNARASLAPELVPLLGANHRPSDDSLAEDPDGGPAAHVDRDLASITLGNSVAANGMVIRPAPRQDAHLVTVRGHDGRPEFGAARAPYLRRLGELEGVIEAGLQMFVEVGEALAEIHDDGLYRLLGHATFKDYAEARWGIDRSYAYRLMDAAETARIVSPIGDIPNEATARALAPLRHDEETARAVWRLTLDFAAAHDKRPTAAMVDEVKRAYRTKARDITPLGPGPTKRPADWNEVLERVSEAVALLADLEVPVDAPKRHDRALARRTTRITRAMTKLATVASAIGPYQVVVSFEDHERGHGAAGEPMSQGRNPPIWQSAGRRPRRLRSGADVQRGVQLAPNAGRLPAGAQQPHGETQGG